MTIFDELHYFDASEFRHPDKMDELFLQWLNTVRTMAGIPFAVTSDARDVAANTRVGGWTTSYHLYDDETGRRASAVDFHTPGTKTKNKPLAEEERVHVIGAVLRAHSWGRNFQLGIYQGPTDWHWHLALRPQGDAKPSRIYLALD